MCTPNELDRIVKRIVEIYKSVYGEKLVKVILYGSYARGDFNSESDVDIAAIVQGNREQLQQQLKQVWNQTADLELEYETILSATVIPYEEFQKYREDLPYYRNIVSEGVEIIA